jgi:hypothetical protein
MRWNIVLAGLLAAVTLTACGGGSSGGIVSAPPNAPAPNPTPAPAPTPVPVGALPNPLGLVSAEPFATVYASPDRGFASDFRDGATQSEQSPALELRYLAASNTYEITLPGKAGGKLVPWFWNGSVTDSRVVAANGEALPDVNVGIFVPGQGPFGRYSYTSIGFWSPLYDVPVPEGQARESGWFAYGVPSKPGDVPTSGKATFRAEIFGYMRGSEVAGMDLSGSALLDFDFAMGRLSGYLDPVVPEGGWIGLDEDDLGRYQFTQTVFGAGSTSFSGRFLQPGMTEASGNFAGIFTGPGAAELMARFEAPFSAEGLVGSISGFWVGKKD